jgi:hypothetical protein
LQCDLFLTDSIDVYILFLIEVEIRTLLTKAENVERRESEGLITGKKLLAIGRSSCVLFHSRVTIVSNIYYYVML